MEDNYLLFRLVPTMRCNYRCSYCFLPHEEKAVRSTVFDLHPPEEWVRAMQNFSDHRVEFYFWGGEPFVIDGTYDLVKGWVEYDHVIGGSRIDTNMAFAEKIAQRCPTDKVKLNCSWHTQYHSYDQIFRKVQLLNDVGMVGMLNFVASPANLEVLRQQYDMTLDELISRFDEIGVFVNIAADFALVNGPRNSGYDEYKRMILQYTNPDDWRHLRSETSPTLCMANQHFFTVHPNGDITPCIGGAVCGNFFEGTLHKLPPAVCTKECPSIVAYPFRTDNSFPHVRHLPEYIRRNREYRDSLRKTSPRSPRPRVSVVLPTYNHLAFLPRAIESILEQTYRDFELIVVNDGSTDGTKEYLETLTDPRIKVIHQENKRLPEALNTGFKAARGELLTWTSSDNHCAPMFLEALVSALDAHPEAGLAYSSFAWIDEQDRIQGVHKVPLLNTRTLLKGNPGMASFMYRQRCQQEVGLYDPALEGAEDWDMWLRLSERFPTVYVPEILYYYRNHADSMTGRMPVKVLQAAHRTFHKAMERAGFELEVSHLYEALRHASDEALEVQAAFDFGTSMVASPLACAEQIEIGCRFLQAAAGLSSDPHILCNLAIGYARLGLWEEVNPLLERLECLKKSGESPLEENLRTLRLAAQDPSLLSRCTLSQLDPNHPLFIETQRVFSITSFTERGSEKSESIQLLLERGESEFGRGNDVAARECFEKVLEQSPGHSQAHSDLAALFWQSGQPEQAMSHIRQALKGAEVDADVLYNAYKLHEATGERGEAKRLLRLYLAQNPSDEAGWQAYESLIVSLQG